MLEPRESQDFESKLLGWHWPKMHAVLESHALESHMLESQRSNLDRALES